MPTIARFRNRSIEVRSRVGGTCKGTGLDESRRQDDAEVMAVRYGRDVRGRRSGPEGLGRLVVRLRFYGFDGPHIRKARMCGVAGSMSSVPQGHGGRR